MDFNPRLGEEMEHKIERRSSDGRDGQENRINKSVPFFAFLHYYLVSERKLLTT